jgi:hypothetical protein
MDRRETNSPAHRIFGSVARVSEQYLPTGLESFLLAPNSALVNGRLLVLVPLCLSSYYYFLWPNPLQMIVIRQIPALATMWTV